MRSLEKILSLLNIEAHKKNALTKQKLLREAKIIGLGGACDAISEFILNKTDGDADALVECFIRFYCSNSKLSRSQWNQDMFVMFFSEMSSDGIYLEVGGADGATHSNTLSLRDHLNWKGILVEPDPTQFQLLKITRGDGRDQLINAAINPAGDNGLVEMRQLGQLSSIVGHEGKDVFHDLRLSAQISKKVKSLPLQDILIANPRFDYFSLDVEGAEVSILKSIDWSKIEPPQLATIEHNHRVADQLDIKIIMKNAGYKQVFAADEWLTKGDYWWIHEYRLNKLSSDFRDLVTGSVS